MRQIVGQFVLRVRAILLMTISCTGLLGLVSVDVRVEACEQPEIWWYDIGTGSVCWRGDLISERFAVDFDGDHNTYALTSGMGWSQDYGYYVNLGVRVKLDGISRYGWVFKIGELKIDGPTAHINETYAGDPTEWFYFWVPKTTPPSDWVVCLQRSDGANPIEVRDTFWYTMDWGLTWNEFTPPSSLDVTIKAHCNTEGLDVNVGIIMDGLPTGYTTPHTFTGLTAIHTFTVQSIDPHGCPFRYWSRGKTNIDLTVTTSGNYTSYYNIDAHDVAVTNVSLSKIVVGQGYYMNITVTLENQGCFTETFGVVVPYFEGVVIPTSIQWETFWSMGDVNRDGYIDDIDSDLIVAAVGSNPYSIGWNPDADLDQDGVIGYEDILVFAPNAGLDIWTYFELPIPSIGTQRGAKLCVCGCTTLTFTWNTTGVSYGNYTTITAYANPMPDETDLDDNTYTDGWIVVTIAGDVNGDGNVDSIDLVFGLGPAMGSRPGDENWNPNADFDNSGTVDSVDLIFVFAPNNGKRWPD